MSDLPPITQKYGVDTTEFKAGIQSLNRQIREIESGFRAVAASMGDWDQSSAGLEARNRSLADIIGVQRQKVQALKDQYEALASSGKASDIALTNLRIDINKAAEALNKSEAEYKKNEDAMSSMANESDAAGKKIEDLGQKEDDAREKTSKLSGVMGGLKTALKGAVTAIAGLAAAAAGAAAGIAGLVMNAANSAGELVDLSNQTGISTTKLQELQYAGDQIGVSLDTMTGSMAKLTRSMAASRGGTGAQAEAFAALGISVTDASGNLRSSQDVFNEVIDKLGAVGNETERDALSMAIFGKSAQDLNPLIKAGSDEINRLTQEARDMGAVMSEESVGALEEFGDSVAGLKASLKGTLGTLAVAFLPMFTELTGTAKKYMGEFAQIVSGSNGDLGQMASGIGDLLGKIITDIAAQAPQMLQAGLAIIKGIGGAILTALPTLIPAVVQMLTSLVGFLIQALPLLMDAGVQLLLALINGIVPQLPMLIQTGLQMIITLVTGIAQALPQLIPVIVGIIPQIILILLENLPLLIDAALQLILALAEGLIAAIPILIPYIPKIVTAIFDAIIKSLPMIVEAAAQLIVTLAMGIGKAMPMIVTAAIDTIKAYANAMSKMGPMILSIGKGIVDGVWKGIQANAATFEANIKGFFAGIVATVKKALGIASPSKVFAGIGENMALGLSAGFDQAISGVQRQVSAGIDALNGAATVTVNGQANGGQAGQMQPVMVNLTMYNTISNDMDVDRVARRAVSIIRSAR